MEIPRHSLSCVPCIWPCVLQMCEIPVKFPVPDLSLMDGFRPPNGSSLVFWARVALNSQALVLNSPDCLALSSLKHCLGQPPQSIK